MLNMDCLRCGSPTANNRKKYCCDSCKYWYNVIRKEKESHLAPVRKRNDKWFFMVVGSTWAKGARQGKRIGSTITGGMAARVNVTVEQLSEVTEENVIKHFNGIPGYIPEYMRLGNNKRIYKTEVQKLLGYELQQNDEVEQKTSKRD